MTVVCHLTYYENYNRGRGPARGKKIAILKGPLRYWSNTEFKGQPKPELSILKPHS